MPGHLNTKVNLSLSYDCNADVTEYPCRVLAFILQMKSCRFSFVHIVGMNKLDNWFMHSLLKKTTHGGRTIAYTTQNDLGCQRKQISIRLLGTN